MWQRFSERARRVIFYAQEAAGRLGENYVSTEHVLLGIVRDTDTVAAHALEAMGFSLRQVRDAVKRQLTTGEGRFGTDMQLTPRAKQVIDLAYGEAKLLGKSYIGTEHLLLGLIGEGEGLAGRVLSHLGVDLDRARQEIRALTDTDDSARLAPPATPLVSIPFPLRPEVGMLGELRPQEGRAVIEGTWTEESMAALLMVFEARDGVGYENLVREGEVVLLPTHIEAKLVHKVSSLPALLVRLRSGEHAGQVVFVFPETFIPTGEDDAPFPPAVESKA
jgi:hypothetical protein